MKDAKKPKKINNKSRYLEKVMLKLKKIFVSLVDKINRVGNIRKNTKFFKTTGRFAKFYKKAARPAMDVS
jgi:hypothetical protein